MRRIFDTADTRSETPQPGGRLRLASLICLAGVIAALELAVGGAPATARPQGRVSTTQPPTIVAHTTRIVHRAHCRSCARSRVHARKLGACCTTALTPRLSATGETLFWTATRRNNRYVLWVKIPGGIPAETVVEGTTVTPAAHPGLTAQYRVRGRGRRRWSNEVSITYASGVAETQRRSRQAGEPAQGVSEQAAEYEARARAERKANESAAREAKESAAREANEKAAREAKEKAARKAKESAVREATEYVKREANEKAAREAKEEAERQAKEEAEREAKENAEREAKGEAEAKQKVEREAREEAEREGGGTGSTGSTGATGASGDAASRCCGSLGWARSAS